VVVMDGFIQLFIHSFIEQLCIDPVGAGHWDGGGRRSPDEVSVLKECTDDNPTMTETACSCWRPQQR
jgi:hypothetical protein